MAKSDWINLIMSFLKERGVRHIIYPEPKKSIIFFGKYVKKILCEKGCHGPQQTPEQRIRKNNLIEQFIAI